MRKQKPALYHFCLMRQVGPGELVYNSGVAQVETPFQDFASYDAFIAELVEKVGWGDDPKKVIVQSLSRL